MIGYRNKQKTKLFKPWIIPFILKDQSETSANRAGIVKITNSISGGKDGEYLKHVTDGAVYIKARFPEGAVKKFLSEIEDESQTDWSSSMVILQQYRVGLETSVNLADCQYVLEVELFKLWDLQEGFSRKADDLQFCMDNDQVKMKALKEWNEWKAKGDDSEAASLRDESSSVPLSQLLAEMACPSLENSTEQGGEISQPVNEAPNNLPDSLIKRLYRPFTLEEFQIKDKQMDVLNEIAVWKPNYQPSPSLESGVEKVAPQPEFGISSVNTLAADNPVRNVPTVLKEQQSHKRSENVSNVQKTPSKEKDRKSANDPRNNRIYGSTPSNASVKKTADQSQDQNAAESQQSQISKFSQADSSLWQQELESVHFSCSDDSLDFGSPTAHSTQVETVQKRVTRCRRLLKEIKDTSGNKSEKSSVKYLGIISQPLPADSNSSDLVVLEQEKEADAISVTNVSSDDSFKRNSDLRNDGTDSNEHSSVRYLGIVTQAVKGCSNSASQIKQESNENAKTDVSERIPLTDSLKGQTGDAQIKREPGCYSQSVTEQRGNRSTVLRLSDKEADTLHDTEIEIEKGNNFEPVVASKDTIAANNNSNDSVNQVNSDKHSELSLNFSSDKSVISPSPEAEESHFSPFPVAGSVSRLAYSRVRKSNLCSTSDQSTNTTDIIDDKSCLAPLVAKMAAQNSCEVECDESKISIELVKDGSVLLEMFHLKDPPNSTVCQQGSITDSNRSIPSMDSNSMEASSEGQSGFKTALSEMKDDSLCTDETHVSDQEKLVTNLTSVELNVKQESQKTCDSSRDSLSYLSKDPLSKREETRDQTDFERDHTDEISVQTENIETGETRELKEITVTPNYVSTRNAKQYGEQSIQKSNFIKKRKTNNKQGKPEKQSQILSNQLHGNATREKAGHGRHALNKVSTAKNNKIPASYGKQRHSLRLLEKQSMDELKNRAEKNNETEPVSVQTNHTVTESGKKRSHAGKKRGRNRFSSSDQSILDDNSERGLYLDVQEMATSEDSSMEENDRNTTVPLKSRKNESYSCRPYKTAVQAKPSTKWEANFFEWAQRHEESGCTVSQCSQCEDASQTLVTEKSELSHNETGVSSAKNMPEECDLNISVRCDKACVDRKSKKCCEIYDKENISKSAADPRHSLTLLTDTNVESLCISDKIRDKTNESDNRNTLLQSLPGKSSADNSDNIIRAFRTIKSKIAKYCGIQSEAARKDDNVFQDNSSGKQTGSDEPLGFETVDSPDLLTGTQPFDTENIRMENTKEAVALPDILTGTQPFDSVFSQTQSFIPNLSSTLRSMSSTSNDSSSLNSEEADKSSGTLPQCLSSNSAPVINSGRPKSPTEPIFLDTISKQQTVELNHEEVRLKSLSKPVDKCEENQAKFIQTASERRKDNESQIKYRIFREKGKQKNNDNNQHITEAHMSSSAVVDSASLGSKRNRDVSLSSETIRCDADGDMVVHISSEETDNESGRNKYDAGVLEKCRTLISKTVLDSKVLKSLSSKILISSDSDKTNNPELETCISVTDSSEDDNSQTPHSGKGRVKHLQISDTLKHLDLSSIRVLPIRRKRCAKEELQGVCNSKNNNLGNDNFENNGDILSVRPYNKKCRNHKIARQKASTNLLESKPDSSESDLELSFETKKHENIKTYGPKKVVIDGHEMGSNNLWMNLVKSPYPSQSKTDQKKSHLADSKTMAGGKIVFNDTLVRKEVDGIFRFVREPAENNTCTKERKNNVLASGVTSEVLSIDTKQPSKPHNIQPGKIRTDIHLKQNDDDSPNVGKSMIQTVVDIESDGNKNISETSQNSIRANNNVFDSMKENCVTENNHSTGDCPKNTGNKSKHKKYNKRKLEFEEVSDCKVSKVMPTDKPDKKINSFVAQSLSEGSKQTKIDSFFKDAEKQDRKKKYLDGLDLRSTFTQEWVVKQTFVVHSSSEESQTSMSSQELSKKMRAEDDCSRPFQTKGQDQSNRVDDTCAANSEKAKDIDWEQVLGTHSAEPPTEVGQKLIQLKLPQDLKDHVTNILRT